MLLLVELFACCFRLAEGAYNKFLAMASQVSSRPSEEISEALRASPDAAQLRNGLISSGQFPFPPWPDPTKVVLSDSEKYRRFSLGALEYARVSHARRPNSPSSFGVSNHVMAWNWAVAQIENNVGDGQWMRAQSLAKIADIFTRSFTMLGNCRFPLFILQEKAEERCDIRRLINGRRLGRN